MANCNVHYIIDTGLIIAAGFCDFTANAGEGVITASNIDTIPDNFKRDYRVHNERVMHATEQEKADYDAAKYELLRDVDRIDKLLLAAFLVLSDEIGLSRQQFKQLVRAKYGTLLIKDK